MKQFKTSIMPIQRSWRCLGMPINFAVLSLCFCSSTFGLSLVTNVESFADAEQRALSIEFSSATQYSVYYLDDPDRLVLDFENTDIRSVRKYFPTKSNIPEVIRFRIGASTAGTTHLVLDLNKSITQPQTSKLSAKHGKERILIRWSIPSSAVIAGNSGKGRLSLAKATTLHLPEEKLPEIEIQETIQTSGNDNVQSDRQKNFNAPIASYLLKSAEQGDASVMYMIGVMYEEGDGVTQNHKRAALWYYQAAAQGYAEAQYKLGVMYTNGNVVTQDFVSAVKWYRKAAEQGYAMAQFNLGAKYATGQGVPQDYKLAVFWYSKAAEQGLANAQNNLGTLFYNGQGVSRNLEQSYKWIALASAAGDLKAANNKKIAEVEMTPRQIAEAQSLVRDWLALRARGIQQDRELGLAEEIKIAPEGSEFASPSPPTGTLQPKTANGNIALVRIERFQVKGNTLLETGLIERLLEPFKGENRSYRDIHLAGEALEGAYRSAGYSAVRIVTPEQNINNGTVVFQVIETAVRNVTLKGNQYYDQTNIRNALPALAEGHSPNVLELSENIQLANQNPTRQIDVEFSQTDEGSTVDAEVNVHDRSPHKIFATLDNTGNPNTGMYRAGVGYQYNNLFNRDQAATVSYVTSPGHIEDVTQISGSYRIPLYSLGDSIDLIAAHSDSNAGTSPIVGGYQLSFSGNGNVYGARYNHNLARQGSYTSTITAGLDYRSYFNNCLISGVAICGGSGSDLTIHPLSISYSGTLSKPAYVTDFTATIVHNLPGGKYGSDSDFAAARGIGAQADYSLLRFNGSLSGALPLDWQYRVAANLQYTRDSLVTYEDIGLVGANAVRGFIEREVANDKGGVLNFEIYTPELAPKFHIENGSFRLLGFIDHGQGWNVPLSGETVVQDSVGSVGVGFRYAHNKDVMAKFDFAKVTDADGSAITKTGDTRGHIAVMVSW